MNKNKNETQYKTGDLINLSEIVFINSNNKS